RAEAGSEPGSARPSAAETDAAIDEWNPVRAPKGSAVHPLAGMNIARDNRYDVTASLSARVVRISATIAESEVAITRIHVFHEEAAAIMSGTIRLPGRGRYQNTRLEA